MAIDRKGLLCAAVAGALLSGCASNTALGLGKEDNWGEANRQTFAAQVINPNPEYAEPLASTDGAAVYQAVERYRTGKVKMPQGQILTNVGRASSSSGN